MKKQVLQSQYKFPALKNTPKQSLSWFWAWQLFFVYSWFQPNRSIYIAFYNSLHCITCRIHYQQHNTSIKLDACRQIHRPTLRLIELLLQLKITSKSSVTLMIATCTSLRTKLQFASNLLLTDIVACRAANTAKNAKNEYRLFF